MKKWLLIIGALVFLGIWFSGMYNSMVDKREEATKMWADVETQYQRRADLIPNLVETVKGYASHEKEALTAVVEARSKATSVNIDPSNMTAEDMQNFSAAQGNLNSALARLMVVVERYPDLKANQSFLQLQSQLEGTENRIAVARKNFNETTTDYNKYIKKFPRVMFAGMMGFEPRPLFESKEGADEAPEVKF